MFNEVLVSFLYANNVQDSKVVDDMSETQKILASIFMSSESGRLSLNNMHEDPP